MYQCRGRVVNKLTAGLGLILGGSNTVNLNFRIFIKKPCLLTSDNPVVQERKSHIIHFYCRTARTGSQILYELPVKSVFRIRIGSGFNRVCVRIRIQNGNPDPDPGRQNDPHKKRQEISCFEVVDVLFRGLETFFVALKSCRAWMPKNIYGILQFLIIKIRFFQLKVVLVLVIIHLYLDPDRDGVEKLILNVFWVLRLLATVIKRKLCLASSAKYCTCTRKLGEIILSQYRQGYQAVIS